MSQAGSRSRIHFLDEVRGFLIVLMVCFHAFYLLGWEFHLPFFVNAFDFFSPVQPFFAGCFIFLCGVSCNLSRNNGKRGWLLLGVSVLVSMVLWCAVFWKLLAPGSEVWFGVLHCLAICILLYDLLQPKLRRVPVLIGLAICAVLFVLCYHVPVMPHREIHYFGIQGLFAWEIPAAATDHPFLYPLGLCPISPTADYYPLLPWFFCFLGGTFAGRGNFPKWMRKSRVKGLSFLGKHSLLIYVFHQPILYLLATAIHWFL